MRAIVFDLDGTLLELDREYEAVLAAAFERVVGEAREEWLATYQQVFFDLFGDCEPDPIRRAFAAAVDGAGAVPGEGSGGSSTDATRGVEAAPDASSDDDAADALVADDIVDALATELREREADAGVPPEGAAADLARLADDHAVGVLTNGLPEWQAHKLRASGLAEHFDCVVASYEVGAHKPAPDPYRAVEERLPADAYAMVGDSDADVEGAAAAGWAAHRYDGGGFGDLPDAIEWG